MLSEQVKLDGFTADDWIRLLSVLSGGSRATPPRRGGMFVLHDGRRIAKAWHTSAGRVAPCEGQPLTADLGALGRYHDAGWVVTSHVEALRIFSERFGARLRREQTFGQQLDLIRAIVRELVAEGQVDAWPRSLRLLPRLPTKIVASALRLIFPRGKTVLLALVSNGALFTSVAVSCDARGVSRISGPVALRRRLPDARVSFGSLCRTIEHAAREAFGPVTLGLYAELSAARRLLAHPSPAFVARAIVRGELQLSPWLSGLVRLPGLQS